MQLLDHKPFVFRILKISIFPSKDFCSASKANRGSVVNESIRWLVSTRCQIFIWSSISPGPPAPLCDIIWGNVKSKIREERDNTPISQCECGVNHVYELHSFRSVPPDGWETRYSAYTDRILTFSAELKKSS